MRTRRRRRQLHHVCSSDLWWQFHQRSTYSFYARRSWKRKKDIDDLTVFFTLSGYTSVKPECKRLFELTSDVNIVLLKRGNRYPLREVQQKDTNAQKIDLFISKMFEQNVLKLKFAKKCTFSNRKYFHMIQTVQQLVSITLCW